MIVRDRKREPCTGIRDRGYLSRKKGELKGFKAADEKGTVQAMINGRGQEVVAENAEGLSCGSRNG